MHAACPGKLLSYNCSPSFNWKKNLNDSQIACSRKTCRLWATSTSSSRWRVSTSTGSTPSSSPMHTPRRRGMKHYTEMVQEPEFAARDKGYTFVSHQQEVGAGYFDDVTTVIQGGLPA